MQNNQIEKKFKVFDREKKRLSKPFTIGSPIIIWEDGDIEMPTAFANIKSDRFVFCQYIGFNDIDDNEIYEYDRMSILDYDLREAPNLERFRSEDGETFDNDAFNKAMDEWEAEEEERDKELGWPRYYEVSQDIATMKRLPVFWLENETFGYEGENIVYPKMTRVIGCSLLEEENG